MQDLSVKRGAVTLRGVDKAALRAWAKGIWRELDRESLAQEVLKGLVAWLEAQRAERVLLYHPLPLELDLRPLLRLYPAQYFLPKVAGLGLTVHPFGPLAPGPFGLLEPTTPPVDPGLIQVALVPGLAFDRKGFRLGHGQGYYDRFLPGLGALTVGVIPEALLLPELPQDPWDLPVAFLATERGVRAREAPPG